LLDDHLALECDMHPFAGVRVTAKDLITAGQTPVGWSVTRSLMQ